MSLGLKWFVVVILCTITRGQSVSTAESGLNITVTLGQSFEFMSPGFPTCCAPTSQTYYLRCKRLKDKPAYPCYFRIYFIEVDLPKGSFVKLFESDGRLLDSISKVWDEVEESWHRPIVASSTADVKVNVHLESSSRSNTTHVGFRAIIHTTPVPGSENWEDPSYTTDCPGLGAREGGAVSVRPIGKGGHLQDCIWQVKGLHGCTVYVNVNRVQGARVQIHLGLSSLAPLATNRVRTGQLMTSQRGIFIRLQKPDDAGVLIFTYGCFLEEGAYTIRSDSGPYADSSPSYCESSVTPPVGIVCEDTSTCIPLRVRCNGYKDCRDASDEVNCPVSSTTSVSSAVPPRSERPTTKTPRFGHRICRSPDPIPCRNGVGCYRARNICDHTAHCADGTDELGCDPTDRGRRRDSSGMVYTVCLIPLAALILAFLAFYRIQLRRGLWRRRQAQSSWGSSDVHPYIGAGISTPPAYSVAVSQPKPEQHVFSCLPDYDTLYGPTGLHAPQDAPPVYSRQPPPDSTSREQLVPPSDGPYREQRVLPPDGTTSDQLVLPPDGTTRDHLMLPPVGTSRDQLVLSATQHLQQPILPHSNC